jgi:hypothetical protein
MSEARRNWSKSEVEAIVADYFDMLLREIQGQPFRKSEHRRKLARELDSRSEGSIEFKHANISAALIDMGIPSIEGYKPRFNYQRSELPQAIEAFLQANPSVSNFLGEDSQVSVALPPMEDLLSALEQPPEPDEQLRKYVNERRASTLPQVVNYVELEQANQALGAAGEEFVLQFERARLLNIGKDSLADKVEQVSRTKGPAAGFDIHSYESDGSDRFIEAKTTKYSKRTPFFVSANEFRYSTSHSERYHVYRVFSFRKKPRLFILHGAVSESCVLDPYIYAARPR